MAALHKCGICGFEGDNFPGGTCPQCGKKISAGVALSPWLGALVQFALMAGFMLIFHFPRPLIIFLAAFIFLGTILSIRLRTRQSARPRPPAVPVRQTPATQLLGVAIGMCGFVFLSCLLFGFVMFMNSWSTWQRFQGQAYHTATFQVVRVYYQRNPSSHGVTTYIYGSGMVEGKKEWMDLSPYLKIRPRSQGELESMVSVGTGIPVYLFPNLKGQSRIQVIGALPPAEANHKQAMFVLNRTLAVLALLGAVIFVLFWIRRSHVEDQEHTIEQASAAGA